VNITQYPFRLPVALDHWFDSMILCYFLDFVGNRLYLPVGSPVTNDIIVGHTARFRHVEFHYIFSTLIITCSDHQLQKLFTLHRFTPSPYYSSSDSPLSSCREAGPLTPDAVYSLW